MASARPGCICTLFLCASLAAAAQGTAPPDPSLHQEPVSVDQVPRVPGLGTVFNGFNAGISFFAVHDSSIGWYNAVTPGISFTFSPHYSADASFSIYPYRLVQNSDRAASSGQGLVATRGDLGDTLLAVHAYFSPQALQHTLTASLTAPTGNRDDGLGTGRVTFDLRDHMERYVHQTGLLVDLGGGDSSGLFNRLVMNEYSSLGPLAHFQAGIIVWLRRDAFLQSVAYEQLPLGDQKIYTTFSRPGMPSRTVVTGRGVSEDNGFTTSATVPVTGHLSFSGYYNRSLRLHLDTASAGMTFVLRGTARRKTLSLIDQAMREAEGGNP